MASFSTWLLAAALLAAATSTPLSPGSSQPPERAPAIPAGLRLDSPLDTAFKRSDKPTPPPIGFPGQPPKQTTKPAVAPGSQPNINIGDQPTQRSVCTYTVTPDKLKDWPCPTGGTLSIYRSWTMETRTVDCKGCGHVFIPASTYHCPIDEIKTTEWIPAATTYTTFVCSPTKAAAAMMTVADSSDGPVEAPGRRWEEESERKERRQGITFSNSDGMVQIGCPTTYMVQPQQTAGVTWTEYKAWSTKTVGLLCGGCPLVTSTAKIGLGPAGRFKTTITMPVGTTTAYKCN